MTSMIRSDALHCEKIARKHTRTFSLATYFLPTRKRRGAFAIHAFCRVPDSIAKCPACDGRDALRRLRGYRRELSEALEGRPSGPVFREIRWAIKEFDIPHEIPVALVDGIIQNIQPPQFNTWDDLVSHCDETAHPVGAMYGAVFGIPGGTRQREIALSHARTLGVAMQLTGILRDVGEDTRLGRCYLPVEELARFSLSTDELFENPELARDPRWHRLMTFEIARARSLYEQAIPGIAMLSNDSQLCAAACVIGYAAILDALEHIRYDSVSTRASVGTLAGLGVLWDAWRFKHRKAG